MTVQTEVSRSGPYAGAGTTGPFTVGFRFLANSHLRVIKTSTTGIDTDLVLTTDYSVSGAGAETGTVTTVAAVLSGEKITILRSVPYTQEADYVDGDSFPAESHEQALDLLTMQTQQNKEAIDRSLTLPATAASVSTELPTPEANSVIGWSEDGTELQNVSLSTLATVVAFGTANSDLFDGNGSQTAFTLSANPGALNNLDVTVSGVPQRPVIDYTWSSGTTITFTSAPPVGTDNVLVRYMQGLPQGYTDAVLVSADDSSGGLLFANVQAFITKILSSAGASIIGFIQAGVGAVVRAIQEKLRESVSVNDFGAVGDGVVDDTAAFTKAFTSLGALGGTVKYFKKHLIDANLTIPANVTLKGPMGHVGTPGTSASEPYGDMAALILNSAATITLSPGAGIDGVLIYRKGMTFPAADTTLYAGTAVTSGGTDNFVKNSMILGFNLAYKSDSGFSRPVLENLNIDCNNGIDLSVCYDVPRLENIHCWPFATYAAGVPATRSHRTGTAFYLHDAVDVPFLSNCFAFGYLNGFYFKNVSTVSATNCSADNTGSYAASVGWRFEGNINGFQSAACSAWSCNVGVYAAHANGQFLPIVGFGLRANISTGIAHYSGNLDVFHNYCTGSAALYSSGHADAAAQVVKIDYNTTDAIGTALVASGYASTTLFVGTHNTTLGTPTNTLISGTTPTCPTVASASPLIPYNYADTQIVTGTTSFGALGGGWAGRELTLVFRGALTVFTSTNPTTGMRLNGSANFVAAAGSTLTLKHDGTQWFESGRSA